MLSTILFQLGQVLSQSTHEIKVVIAADNLWKLNVAGKIIIGPKDFTSVTTWNIPLQGEGPWVVGIEAQDFGGLAGLFSSIYFDGKPYTATGNNFTKFKASEFAAENWLNPDFNDNSWATGANITSQDCIGGEATWNANSKGTFLADLKSQSPDIPIHASWFPNCSAINKDLYFRVLVTNPSPVIKKDTAETSSEVNSAMNPNTTNVSNISEKTAQAHEIRVVIAADDFWTLNVAGKTFFGPRDGADGFKWPWTRVSTIELQLPGEGPWVVGIKVEDFGELAALFSSIYLDGKPYTATGNNMTKFKASEFAAENWLNPDFNDNSWATGADISTLDCRVSEGVWYRLTNGQFFTDLNMRIHASWFPNCSANNKGLYFRVLVTNPNPVAKNETKTSSTTRSTTTTEKNIIIGITSAVAFAFGTQTNNISIGITSAVAFVFGIFIFVKNRASGSKNLNLPENLTVLQKSLK